MTLISRFKGPIWVMRKSPDGSVMKEHVKCKHQDDPDSIGVSRGAKGMNRSALIDRDSMRVVRHMRATGTKAVAIDYGEAGVCFYVDMEPPGSGRYNLHFFWGTTESIWHVNEA